MATTDSEVRCVRALLAVAFLAALLPGPPATAQTPALRGDLTLSGTSTSVMRVHAASRFTVSTVTEFTYDAPPNPDVQVSGLGRAVGVVLTQNTAARHNRRSDNDGATLFALRYGMCEGAGCAPVRGGVGAILGFGPGVSTGEGTVTLPKGDYNLYLLTDGGHATVRLRLHGLGGSGTLRPTQRASSYLAEATPTDPTGRRYLSDERHRFTGLGLIAVATIARSDLASNPRTSYCITRTSAEANAATDTADGETGCMSTIPATVLAQATGQDGGNAHGFLSASGNSGGTNWAAGHVSVLASFDPGIYRSYVTAEPTPADDSHSFTTLWLPWR